MTTLILQGLQTDAKVIAEIAALSGASHYESIAPHTYSCDNVNASADIVASIDAACCAASIDYTLLPVPRRLSDFKLVAMDMDSTLITIECIDEIADMQGLKPQVAAITEAAMRGELDFAESLTRRVALLKGLDASALQQVYDERLNLSPGAQTMIKAVQAAGLKTLVVSGGFTFFADRVKDLLNLDYAHANTLEIVDGKLTGRVLGTIVDAEEKKRMVEQICGELGVPTSQAIVIGDGANDLKMMGISGMSVAFRAKPVVRAQADVALNFVGLDGILPLF